MYIVHLTMGVPWNTPQPMFSLESPSYSSDFRATLCPQRTVQKYNGGHEDGKRVQKGQRPLKHCTMFWWGYVT